MMKLLKHCQSVLIALSLCLLPSAAHAAGPYENTTTGTVSNANNPCTGTAFTRDIVVNDSFSITDLDVGLAMTHAWRLDIQATLTKVTGAGAGTSVVMINSASNPQYQNYNVTLDDEEAVTVNTGTHTGTDPLSPLYGTRVRPNNLLSAFDGIDAQGTWRLSLCDIFAADDGGFLSAELIFAGQASSGTPPTLTCGSSALRHDWNNFNWPAGSLSNQYTTSGEDFRITMTGATSSFIPIPATTTNTPVTNSLLTGGQGVTESALLMVVNHPNATSAVTATIDIGDLGGGTNNGVGELQFSMFDVDFNAAQFQDRVTITGSNGVSTVTPIVTRGTANTVSGTTATGQSSSDSALGDGNVTVTFLEKVNQVTIIYGNGTNVPADPGQQAVAIYDLLTCPVLTAVLEGEKTTRTFNNNYALPGNDVIYTITVRNTGTGPTDTDSVVLIDKLPTEIEFFRGATASTPVTFVQTGAGLTYTYATDIGYSNAATKPTGMGQCTYAPVAGYDPAVTYICFNPKGAMAAGDPDPEFSFEFRARIK